MYLAGNDCCRGGQGMRYTYHYDRPFTLESGDVLPDVTIAYDVFGRMSAARDNVVWVCHALTANSDVADWWPNTVVPGRFLDPDRWCVVCANVLGSHYGTTGPLSLNASTCRPWYSTFPRFTVRDIVAVHRLLAEHLGIGSVQLLIGSSLGGFQCMEWAVADTSFARNLVLIATCARTRPWAAAFNESQRMAIESDPTYGLDRDDAGLAGMAVARSVALLSYRGGTAYDLTQSDADGDYPSCFTRRVQSYQRHQGDKLARRFNAYSYVRLSQAVDSHDVGRGRGSVAQALSSIKSHTLVVAISSDILFPPCDHAELVDNIPDVQYALIDSSYGHDGFLIEYEQLDKLIKDFMR